MPISDKMLDISLLMFNFTLIELSLLRENVRDEGADKRVFRTVVFHRIYG